MTKDIKSIIGKGKLTGEEVGRIFLRDYARFVEATQTRQDPPKDLFSEADKQTLVNRLKDPLEIRTYNAYVGIIQFLQKLGILYNQYYELLNALFYGLLRDLEALKYKSIINLLLNDAPLILTESQYKALKKDDLETKLNKKTSSRCSLHSFFGRQIKSAK